MLSCCLSSVPTPHPPPAVPIPSPTTHRKEEAQQQALITLQSFICYYSFLPPVPSTHTAQQKLMLTSVLSSTFFFSLSFPPTKCSAGASGVVHFFFRSSVISGTACKHQCRGSICSPLCPPQSLHMKHPTPSKGTCPPVPMRNTQLHGLWVTPAHSTPRFPPAE